MSILKITENEYLGKAVTLDEAIKEIEGSIAKPTYIATAPEKLLDFDLEEVMKLWDMVIHDKVVRGGTFCHDVILRKLRTFIAANPIQLVVSATNAPIPMRGFDYQCVSESYDEGDIIGYGETPQEAINSFITSQCEKWDLMDNYLPFTCRK